MSVVGVVVSVSIVVYVAIVVGVVLVPLVNLFVHLLKCVVVTSVLVSGIFFMLQEWHVLTDFGLSLGV